METAKSLGRAPVILRKPIPFVNSNPISLGPDEMWKGNFRVKKARVYSWKSLCGISGMKFVRRFLQIERS